MNFFSNPPRWLDQLPIPLLPHEHGKTLESQMEFGVKVFREFVDSGRPFSLIRLSDGDLAILSAGLFPLIREGVSIDELLVSSGMDRNGFEFRSLLIDAVTRTDLLGLQQNWNSVAKVTLASLNLLGINIPVPYGIEVHVPYSLLTKGLLFEFLENKKVLIVGSLAEDLANFLQDESLCKKYSFVRPLRNLSYIKTPDKISRAYTEYNSILEKVLKSEFDVAIVGFGVYAKPLCVAIRDSGRIGLDIGFCFDAILGHPARKLRPILRDINWDDKPNLTHQD